MAADYGIDVDGVLDWPDPEVDASGPKNLANALARMLLTPNGAHTDIGDDEPFETMNLRDWLGARPTDDEIRALNTLMQNILQQDERVASVSASAAFALGVITITVQGQGAAGPFGFVLTIESVTSAKLQVL